MLQTAGETFAQTSPHAFLRRLTSVEPALLIQPTGWEMGDDELWASSTAFRRSGEQIMDILWENYSHSTTGSKISCR
jgi:hypothetical protein